MAKKILIVDDSALMRRMLCDIIQSDKSYEVSDIATNGEEALELIMKNLYDAILMDINMPKKNGKCVHGTASMHKKGAYRPSGYTHFVCSMI